jgi:hypothetical protein
MTRLVSEEKGLTRRTQRSEHREHRKKRAEKNGRKGKTEQGKLKEVASDEWRVASAEEGVNTRKKELTRGRRS